MLQNLHRTEIDLILLDLGLPKLSGWQTYLKIKEQNPHLRVIRVSGYLDPAVKSEVVRAGAKDFLQKTLHPGRTLEKNPAAAR